MNGISPDKPKPKIICHKETFEKCSILFKFKPPARGAYAPEGKAKTLTTPYDLPDLRGRQEYFEYFED
jgi:hypothetical protein